MTQGQSFKVYYDLLKPKEVHNLMMLTIKHIAFIAIVINRDNSYTV